MSGGFAVVEEDLSVSASKFPSVSSLLINVASVVWVLPISFNQWQIWDVTSYVSRFQAGTYRGIQRIFIQGAPAYGGHVVDLPAQVKAPGEGCPGTCSDSFWVFPRLRLHGFSGPAVPVQIFPAIRINYYSSVVQVRTNTICWCSGSAPVISNGSHSCGAVNNAQSSQNVV